MNQDVIIAVIGAVLGSGLIQFLITRHDNNKAKPIEQKIDKIIEEQKKSEKDNLRTQLLVMMNLMSDNKEDLVQNDFIIDYGKIEDIGANIEPAVLYQDLIKRIREKISDHEKWKIETVWGVGYKFTTV